MSRRLVSERSRPDECLRLFGGLPDPQPWAVVHYIECSPTTWEAVSSVRFDTHADARRHFDAFQLGAITDPETDYPLMIVTPHFTYRHLRDEGNVYGFRSGSGFVDKLDVQRFGWHVRRMDNPTLPEELETAPDPEYADVDTDGQLALGVAGDQRAIPGLAAPRKES